MWAKQAAFLHSLAVQDGLRMPPLHVSQGERRVVYGRAWIRFSSSGVVAGRREGVGVYTEGERWPKACGEAEGLGADFAEWALAILRTGRTVEVGHGVGLPAMQALHDVPFETIDYPLTYLAEVVRREDDLWDLDPGYQRAHVWTREQREKFVGYFLVVERMPLVFLNLGHRQVETTIEVVDGKQRIQSLLMFLDGEIPGVTPEGAILWWRDFDEIDRRSAPAVKCARMYMPTRKEVLNFYINLNSGGTVHTEAEIARVKKLRDEA